MLAALVEDGKLTPDEAELARSVPVAEDVTVEADSGGHTDNRPLPVLLPMILELARSLSAQHGYTRAVRVGVGGGLGTPSAIAAAFGMGAAYVVTGSVNQAAVESALSDDGRRMLAEASMTDVAMAPAADMFEMGVESRCSREARCLPNVEKSSTGSSVPMTQSSQSLTKSGYPWSSGYLVGRLKKYGMKRCHSSKAVTLVRLSVPLKIQNTRWRLSSDGIFLWVLSGPVLGRRTVGAITRFGADPLWAPSTNGPEGAFLSP